MCTKIKVLFFGGDLYSTEWRFRDLQWLNNCYQFNENQHGRTFQVAHPFRELVRMQCQPNVKLLFKIPFKHPKSGDGLFHYCFTAIKNVKKTDFVILAASQLTILFNRIIRVRELNLSKQLYLPFNSTFGIS